MRRSFYLLFSLLLISTLAFAQSVTLATTTANPSKGTVVYNNGTNQLQYWNGTAWIPITNAASGTGWALNGNNIYNNNIGNVGVGTPTPKATFNVEDGKTVLFGSDSSGIGNKLIWYPSKGAFRIGIIDTYTPNNWDYLNVGIASLATGQATIAKGYLSTAMGYDTKALGTSSTALGSGSRAEGFVSTALGSSGAYGNYSTSIGELTQAFGEVSTAIGYNSKASGDYSTAMGYNSTASGLYSIAMGKGSTASNYNSTAMGEYTLASGSNSTAMGENTTASGNQSTSMGYVTNAFGLVSTAMGHSTTASGESSTAMGNGTTASGNYSTAMGNNTFASGINATAMGIGTIASTDYTTAMGTYNFDVPNSLLTVGTGYKILGNTTRKNALTILNNGRVGIGTTDPLAVLHVAGNNILYSGTSEAYWFGAAYSTGSSINSITNGSWSVGLLVDYDILGKRSIVSAQAATTSDARIKNIIGLSNNQQDLAKVRQIQITDYRYKDVATWGNQTFKKVIAQQVEAIYPQAVRKMTSTIPDIYSLAEKVTYNETIKTLTCTLSKEYDIKVGEKIEFVHEKQGKIQAEVIEVSGNNFTVKNWQYPTDKIFVFGREVNDFITVDYEAISMLGISAIQELAKENEELRKELREVKEKGESLNSRLLAIESILNPAPYKSLK